MRTLDSIISDLLQNTKASVEQSQEDVESQISALARAQNETITGVKASMTVLKAELQDSIDTKASTTRVDQLEKLLQNFEANLTDHAIINGDQKDAVSLS